MNTLLLGFDAFDPNLFEQLLAQGRMPNLARYVDLGGYSKFGVANPPQSEVSWTSIATGLDPDGHGIFDFVHRDPKTYSPYVSLLPTKRSLGGIQFVPPFSARTIFDEAVRKGYPATSLWWPATFPARPASPVNTLPGLGTPDILGKLGVGVLFTSEAGYEGEGLKTAVEILEQAGKGRYKGSLQGPARQKGSSLETSVLPFELEILDDQRVRINLGEQTLELSLGKWSPIIELTFKIGFLAKVVAVTRLILTSLNSEVKVYMLPMQIHPLHSPWPYGTPPGFIKRTWRANGPFLTLGWPQDTTGLEDGCISDDQFLELCESIFARREAILLEQISTFREGVLASVFDSLDRIQHMFWRDRQDVVEKWVIMLDGLVGRVDTALKAKGGKKPRMLIVSDHGFASFDYKIHLNRWLIERGYLVPEEQKDSGNLKAVNWELSQVYALGLNSLYLNLAGREGRGKVEKEAVGGLLNELHNDLLSWKGPDKQPVIKSLVSRVDDSSEIFPEYGPDLIVGYSPGYRASPQTGLGEWVKESIEPNRDHWGADHCIDPASVPGVLFYSPGLDGHPSPTYRDIPMLAIGEKLDAGASPPPPSFSGEDQEILEERLKGLGYL